MAAAPASPTVKKGTSGQQLDIVRREIADGEYYYFAVLEIGEADDPPADGYDVIPGIIRVTRKKWRYLRCDPQAGADRL